MSNTLHIQVSELQGAMPDVPLANGIDYSALVLGDTNPVFLTLPLMKAGTVSRNGRRYDAAAVSTLVEQINKHRPGGIKGHLPAEQRSTRFDLPSLMWVGARLDADGMAWGKAYIPQYAADVREYVLKSKARRAAVATSIYGTAQMDGDDVRDLQIESIDLVDPTRAGVPDAVAEPVVTTESIQEGSDMSDQLIAEVRKQQTEIAESLRQISELQKQVAELTPLKETLTAIREMVGQDDVIAAIKTLKADMEKAQVETRKNSIAEAIKTALGDIAKNPEATQVIGEMVGAVDSPDTATARVKALLEQDHVKKMLKALTVGSSGPAALVGESFSDAGRPKVDDSPEAINSARSQWGI